MKEPKIIHIEPPRDLILKPQPGPVQHTVHPPKHPPLHHPHPQQQSQITQVRVAPPSQVSSRVVVAGGGLAASRSPLLLKSPCQPQQ